MAQLSTIITSYKKRTIGVARDACDELSTRTASRTPVDTGVLRKSWTPALNKFDNSNSGGNSGIVTAQMKAGDDYTYTNGQDYVRVIEYDAHSPQAPGGMMRISVAEWQSIVSDAARRANRGI